MKCNQVRELMPDAAAGKSELTAEAHAHLQGCAACTAELTGVRKTMALLDEWRAPEPSPYFDTRMQARLREEKTREAARSQWFGWLRRPALVGVATVLVVAGVGFFTTQHSTPAGGGGAKMATVQQPGTAVGDLQALDKNDELYADFDVLDELQVQQENPQQQGVQEQ
jgi:predicted anti-sigma-YlaC factor YlaD